jgi:hypothetical protein
MLSASISHVNKKKKTPIQDEEAVFNNYGSISDSSRASSDMDDNNGIIERKKKRMQKRCCPDSRLSHLMLPKISSDDEEPDLVLPALDRK